MTDILTALTSAPYGSGHLDEAIARWMGWAFRENAYGEWLWQDNSGLWHASIPAWTTCTDAALSLFWPDIEIEMHRAAYIADVWICRAWISIDSERCEGKSHTIPLAICIAWARSQGEKS